MEFGPIFADKVRKLVRQRTLKEGPTKRRTNSFGERDNRKAGLSSSKKDKAGENLEVLMARAKNPNIDKMKASKFLVNSSDDQNSYKTVSGGGFLPQVNHKAFSMNMTPVMIQALIIKSVDYMKEIQLVTYTTRKLIPKTTIK